MTLLSRLRPWPRPDRTHLRPPAPREVDVAELARLAVAVRYQLALARRDKAAMAQAVADLQALDSDTPLALQSTNKEDL